MRCFILYADLSVSAGSPISGARTPRESAARKEENVSVPIPSLGPHVIVGQSSGNQLWNEESCSNVTELVIDHSRPFLMRESRCVSPLPPPIISSLSSRLFSFFKVTDSIFFLLTVSMSRSGSVALSKDTTTHFPRLSICFFLCVGMSVYLFVCLAVSASLSGYVRFWRFSPTNVHLPMEP